MDRHAVLAEVQNWPVDERLLLIDEVWDQLTAVDDVVELPAELTTLLDYRATADAVVVIAFIHGRRRPSAWKGRA